MKYLPVGDRVSIVDDESFEHLSQWKWRCDAKGYVVRSTWLKQPGGGFKHTTLRLHRVINNTPPGFETDHINGDKLDNRKSNLRSANRSQNTQNVRTRKDNKAGYKGVCWREKSQDFVAYINVNKKRICLKTFKRFEDAVAARKAAEIKYHKEFAYSANGG